jgi:hypothetical protein
MLMKFVSYKLYELFVCLMCFQMFFVCINHFLQFTPFLFCPFESVKEGFYCICYNFSTQKAICTGLNQFPKLLHTK